MCPSATHDVVNRSPPRRAKAAWTSGRDGIGGTATGVTCTAAATNATGAKKWTGLREQSGEAEHRRQGRARSSATLRRRRRARPAWRRVAAADAGWAAHGGALQGGGHGRHPRPAAAPAAAGPTAAVQAAANGRPAGPARPAVAAGTGPGGCRIPHADGSTRTSVTHGEPVCERDHRLEVAGRAPTRSSGSPGPRRCGSGAGCRAPASARRGRPDPGEVLEDPSTCPDPPAERESYPVVVSSRCRPSWRADGDGQARGRRHDDLERRRRASQTAGCRAAGSSATARASRPGGS